MVATTIFETLLETIIPLKGRSARTKGREAGDIPLVPSVHELLRVRITTLMDYRSHEVQDLIRSLKYDSSRHAARLAADLLADYLREELASQRNFSQKKIFIVPVPLHAARVRERGYNQIEIVLRELPREFQDGTFSLLAPDVLKRTRATKPQTRLPRSERLSNVAGAFGTDQTDVLSRAVVYLLDDVTTTGATLANAAQPLRRAGAEVHLIALARA